MYLGQLIAYEDYYVCDFAGYDYILRSVQSRVSITLIVQFF